METKLKRNGALEPVNSEQARQLTVGRASPTTVHVWATGQDDNIGDSLLRRGYLDALRGIGALNVWTGPASGGFLTGLGLQPHDSQEKSFAAWYWNAFKNAALTRTFIAMNAGEVPVSRKGAVRLAALAVLTAWCRLRGGGGIWVGAGVPNTHATLAIPYKAVATTSIFVRWRDRPSGSNVVDKGTAPDWAFMLGTEVSAWRPATDRRKLAVILRGDRPRPSDTWIAWVRTLAEVHGLQPTVVVQVRRDNELGAELAKALSGDLLAWTHEDHAAQEAAVRQLYRESAVAIGDRLHGLIVAATEGAIPLGWVASSKGKISRHFKVVGLDWVGQHEGSNDSALPVLDHAQLSRYSDDLATAVTAARSNLEATVAGLYQRVRHL